MSGGLENIGDMTADLANFVMPDIKVCSRCILPETYPKISFDADGVCSYCHQHKNFNDSHLRVEYYQKLLDLVNETRQTYTSKYDVLMAFSGGKDSTYSMMLLKTKYKLNVISFTFDNGFISPQALKNIATVCERLDIPHIMARYDLDIVTQAYKAGSENEMYSMSYMNRASTICTICSGFFKSFALRYALENSIPLIGYGWSPGQAPIATSIQKTNPNFSRMGQENAARPVIAIVGDSVKKYYLTEDHYKVPAEKWPWNVHPLAFEAYNEHAVKEEIKSLGWVAPQDVDTNSTNCLLNAYANQVHIDRYRFHPYASEVANMVRQGVMNRAEALVKIYTPQNTQLVEMAAKRLNSMETHNV